MPTRVQTTLPLWCHYCGWICEGKVADGCVNMRCKGKPPAWDPCMPNRVYAPDLGDLNFLRAAGIARPIEDK